ncbi:MAG TPA: AAA family ATPase [Vicinamibacterales bacterium]|jgi:MoxR-like ATPase
MLLDWTTTEAVIAGSRLCLLYGPPGTGKTTAAVRAGSPGSFYNVTLTDETPAAELRGHYIPADGNFVWQDGPAMRAFREGTRLVLNEIDHASGDALDFCHCLLDDPGIAAITLPTGETVHPSPGFTVVATMNGEPGDLPPAIRDRFAVAIEVTEPHPDAIAGMPEAVQDAIRGTVGTDDDEQRTSLRAWRSYLDLADKVGDETAARAVFGIRAGEILAALKLADER